MARPSARERLGIAALLAVVTVAMLPVSAGAASNPWPNDAAGGFSSPEGDGFWVARANGAVTPYGGSYSFGDASGVALAGPIVGGTGASDGDGYWLVASDGGIFTYGSASFYGSMGGAGLNQPVFSMASTRSGRGYWLVARDGGIFTFGDGRFYGSTGGISLAQPVAGITTSPTGRGYRMVARDGGLFGFGDAKFYGSLPGIGVIVSDVVGMAPTPSGRGYWIARATGGVYAFGDAKLLGFWNGVTPDDPVVSVFSNPVEQGYRLVKRSGETKAFGAGVAGTLPTGDLVCPSGVMEVVPTSVHYTKQAATRWQVQWTVRVTNRTPAFATAVSTTFALATTAPPGGTKSNSFTANLGRSLGPDDSAVVSGLNTILSTTRPRITGSTTKSTWVGYAKPCPPPG